MSGTSSPGIEIDASVAACCWLACVPFTFGAIPYKTTIHLDNEEVTKTDLDLCGRHVSRIPYNELGSVDRGRCCCWVYVDSSFGSLSPGCGCDAERVDFIVSELRIRMRNHGNWTLIQRAEQTIQKLDDINTKLESIIDHFNIPKPMKMESRSIS